MTYKGKKYLIRKDVVKQEFKTLKNFEEILELRVWRQMKNGYVMSEDPFFLRLKELKLTHLIEDKNQRNKRLKKELLFERIEPPKYI